MSRGIVTTTEMEALLRPAQLTNYSPKCFQDDDEIVIRPTTTRLGDLKEDTLGTRRNTYHRD